MKTYLLLVLALTTLAAMVLGGIPQYGKFGYGLVIHHPSHHGHYGSAKSYRYDHRVILPNHHHHSFDKHNIGFDIGHGHGVHHGYEIDDGIQDYGHHSGFDHAGDDFHFDDDIGGFH